LLKFGLDLSLEEADIVRRRAEGFLRNAESLMGEGERDLAVSNLEQYCRLMQGISSQ